MGDLSNPRLIYAKGFLFLLCGLISATLLMLTMPDWRNVFLLCVTIWSFCRFYFFLFYVIEHYVDGRYRFSGLINFLIFYVKRCNHRSINEPIQSAETQNQNR
ncbi:MAG: hypothetical protein P8J37_05755 [Fuerstiella sp.]|jgi:hypothetical protein|nr:hypothetical protein [Fuerstiella sp.]